ncbi:hypothetical protein pCXcHC2016_12 [Xenohaliotis phage pCXc-HC2016]|nr:hypothetical protein pCXcHC2016_12 [Xenohaliotis phage pCXc-HC2016]AQW89119.1 hypothetical protein pCXcHR2015_12 [Xenohaliotis phage pCXc-HR2015]
MANIINEKGDFHLSSLSARVMGGRVVSDTLSGTILANECMIEDNALSKRPPLKFISRTARNDQSFLLPEASPGQTQKLFLAISDTTALAIKDGREIETTAEDYMIVRTTPEGYVTLDKALPIVITGSNIIAAFSGNQQYELFTYFLVSENTYDIRPLVGGDDVSFSFYTKFKAARVITTPAYAIRPVDSIQTSKLNYFFTGTGSKSYTISDAGVFAELSDYYSGDAAIVYFNRLFVGSTDTTTGKLKLTYSAQASFALDASSKNITLIEEYGNILFWLRANSRGIILSTDAGIFLLEFDDPDAMSVEKISRYDFQTSNAVSPVKFRDFLIFVDSAGFNLSYVYYEFYNTGLSVSFLTTFSDMLVGEEIIKLSIIYLSASPIVIALTSTGRVAAVRIAKVSENNITGSFMEWFVDYSVGDFYVYRKINENSLLIGMFHVEHYSYFASLDVVKVPTFRDTKSLTPFIDFYSEVDTRNIFPAQVDLRVVGTSQTVDVYSESDYFDDRFIGVRIANKSMALTVQQVFDGRHIQAARDIQTEQESYLQANNYEILINTFYGLNHLYPFLSSDIPADVPRGTSLQALLENNIAEEKYKHICQLTNTEVVGRYDFGVFYSHAIVGRLYAMDVVFSPIVRAGDTLGFYAAPLITYENIGYYQPTVEFYDGDSRPVVRTIANETMLHQKLPVYKRFLTSTQLPVPIDVTNSLLIGLYSTSMVAPYISIISIASNYSGSKI